MPLTDILQNAVTREASDVLVVAGLPVDYKINGRLCREGEKLFPAQTLALTQELYSLAGREDRMDDYQKALTAQISEGAPLARGYTVNSIYIGGGTPSWYGEKRLCELLRLLQKKFKMAKDIEVTVEANPDSVTEKALRAVRFRIPVAR